MWFGVISLLPELMEAHAGVGVFGRAVAAGIVKIDHFNPRKHTSDRHQTVDDRPYGGGPGMVMRPEPLLASIQEARVTARKAVGTSVPVIHLTPQGERLTQDIVKELSELPGMILLCGRYEGVDERVIAGATDRGVSIGDYVLTGGELAAQVVMDAVCRYLPGTLGNFRSALEESHLDGLLDYPHYTRPESAEVGQVPPVLLSGDHAAITRWRQKEALRKTWLARPDLLSARPLSGTERTLLAELFAEGLADARGSVGNN